MIVPITDELRIRGTEFCWELQRARARHGKQEWEPFKYYSSFGRALEAAVEREIRLHPATTIAEAIEAVSAISHRYGDLFCHAFGNAEGKR